MGVCSSSDSTSTVAATGPRPIKSKHQPNSNSNSPNPAAITHHKLNPPNPISSAASSPPLNQFNLDETDLDSPQFDPQIQLNKSGSSPINQSKLKSNGNASSSIEATVLVQPHEVDSMYIHPNSSSSHPHSSNFPPPSFDMQIQFVHGNELRLFEVNQLDYKMKIHQFQSRVLAAHRQELNRLNAADEIVEKGGKKPKVLLIHQNRIMDAEETLASRNINENTCEQESVLLLFSRSPPFNPELRVW